MKHIAACKFRIGGFHSADKIISLFSFSDWWLKQSVLIGWLYISTH